MRLIPWSPVYEPYTPSYMSLIHCMRGMLIYDSYMSLMQNVCKAWAKAAWARSRTV